MIEMLVNWVVAVLGKMGYMGVGVFMALESACIPIPSEAVLPFGGYLASSANVHNQLNIIGVILSGTIGGTMGSLFAYYLGVYGGRPVIDRYTDRLGLSKSHLKKSHRMFEKHGEKIVFYSRLLPIIRTFISLPAGISKMDVKKFTVYTFIGSLIWSIILVYAGYIMGENWKAIQSWLHIADYIVVAAGAVLIIYYFVRKRKKLVVEGNNE